jgi:hypothetical protein
LRLQFQRVENRDQISFFHRHAFVHRELYDPARNLRAYDDLIGVHGSDQDQVARAGCGSSRHSSRSAAS